MKSFTNMSFFFFLYFRLVAQVAEKLQHKILSGVPGYDARNEVSVDLVRCAEVIYWHR